MLSYRYDIEEGVKIAKLWQGFRHLSEDDKDLVLALTEAVGCSEQDTQAAPEQAGCFCNCTLQEKEKNELG